MCQSKETMKLSEEERNQIMSLLEKYSKAEIEMALRQLSKNKVIK